MEGEGVWIADYDRRWPELFAELRDRIADVLGEMVIAIEHVGSTSVPDLPAKPIIDIDVVVRAKDVPEAIRILEQNGYRHEGNLGIEGREAFRWTAKVPDHHLYLCPEGSPAFQRHIVLRDYLRKNPDAAREYAELKRCLAQQYKNDRTKYQDAKQDFVEKLYRAAKRLSEEDAQR
jgi:GrpB-like predicted nucleotidyltransferase (UPF0157 family)